MKSLEGKRGISLIVLVTTIIILLILVSVAVLNVADGKDATKKTVFISDMTHIEDAVKEYYITNGVVPSYGDVIEKSKLTSVATLENEITAKQDTDSSFYRIDLSKLDLTKFSFGTKYTDSTSNDILVVAMPSLNVYYVKGIKIEDKVYHSLTDELTGKTSYNNGENDTSSTIITSNTASGRLKVIKTNKPSASVSATIIAQMKEHEDLKLVVGSLTMDLTVATGNNVIVLEDTLPENVITKINEEKSITLKIVDSSSKVVEELTVDFDIVSSYPEFLDGDVITSYDTENTLTFNVRAENGLAYIKYDYLDMYSIDNVTEKYYKDMTDAKLDEHIYANGKTCSISSNGPYTISAPKNVKTVRIVATDKAGNSTYVTKNISKGLYAYPSTSDVKGKSVSLDISAISTVGIKDVTVYYSSDNANFTSAGTYTVNLTGNVTNKHSISLENIITNKIYVKITMTNYAGSVTETSLHSLDVVNDYEVIDASIIALNKEAYYGDTVIGYDNAAGVNEWQIFHSDGNNIYIIAKDYLTKDKVPLLPDGSRVTTASNGCVDFKGAITYYTNPSSVINSRNLNVSFTNAYPASTASNSNMKAVAYLSDDNVWKNFKGSVADFAIGAPYASLFVDSYNSVSHKGTTKKLYTNIPNANGYYFSANNTNFDSILSGIQGAEYNYLYIKPTSGSILGMWIASPSGGGEKYLFGTMSSGGAIMQQSYDRSNYGLRPVVRLKSNIQLEETASGAFKIR